ncbi:hypothetical protein [Deinococcus malanensis]|uniref:hypothetical protein n=2 Tax=Deinococcus malanensis TaxID=1706855 RepID=UPI001663F326|nr:hypothetical protein [Deinococcus malanensis]
MKRNPPMMLWLFSDELEAKLAGVRRPDTNARTPSASAVDDHEQRSLLTYQQVPALRA